MFNDANEFFETSAQGGGKVYRFKDIDGIGPATAKKIKNVRLKRGTVQNPEDVADMSADELSDKAGISRDRASKAIKGGGGNPNVSKQSNTGSVSAAGIKMPVGEFLVEAGDDDKARAKNDTFSRSKEAIRQDDRKRAPITTDVERWENNKSGLDFPGVDTPTQDPQVLPKDLKQKRKPRTTEPDEQSQAAQTTGFDAFPEARAGGSMEDAFMAEMAGRDVPASPDEVVGGTGVVASNALGGNVLGEGERSPTNEPKQPPESALRRQQRTQDEGIAGADTPGAEIAFIYQNEGQDTDLSLSEFRDRTKRVGRKLGLEGDAFGNAQMVAYDEDVNEKF